MRTPAMILASLLMVGSCSKQSQDSGEPEGSSVGSAAEAKATDNTASPVQGDQKAESPKAHKVSWLHDLDKAQAKAKEQGRDLFIDVSASWCAPCQELEEVTFADDAVAKRLRENFVPLNLDVTEQTDKDKALMDEFGVKLLPALLVVRDEKILLTIRTFIGPRELEAKLDELPTR